VTPKALRPLALLLFAGPAAAHGSCRMAPLELELWVASCALLGLLLLLGPAWVSQAPARSARHRVYRLLIGYGLALPLLCGLGGLNFLIVLGCPDLFVVAAAQGGIALLTFGGLRLLRRLGA